jgi:hypothetical protein
MTDQPPAALPLTPIGACARMRAPLYAAAIPSIPQSQRMFLWRLRVELRSHICLRSNRWSDGRLSRSGCRLAPRYRNCGSSFSFVLNPQLAAAASSQESL